MSEKLKEHVLKHAHSLGKKKIDVIVNNYVANLVCDDFFQLKFNFSKTVI